MRICHTPVVVFVMQGCLERYDVRLLQAIAGISYSARPNYPQAIMEKRKFS
jgi:hypothetical protein